MTSISGAKAMVVRRKLMLAGLLGAAALAQVRASAADDASAFARTFDGLNLVDQDGQRFSFAAFAGRILLINFVYTGCSTVCPIQTHVLAAVQRALQPQTREAIHFVSVSLDPSSDTPSALKSYALRMGADLSRWSFVTGAVADVARVAERLRLFRPDAKRPDEHSTNLWLVDARGLLIQRLPGSTPDQARLVRELTGLWEIDADRQPLPMRRP